MNNVNCNNNYDKKNKNIGYMSFFEHDIVFIEGICKYEKNA